jgi:hypothetical protein
MISARVAGVPRPRSFMASESSRSSREAPAISIAVRSVASVKRRGGRVFFSTASAAATRFGWPAARPGGRASSALPSRLSPCGRGGRDGAGSRTLQPACSAVVPELWNRSAVTGSPPLSTRVIAVVTATTCSSCQAMSSRRQTRS